MDSSAQWIHSFLIVCIVYLCCLCELRSCKEEFRILPRISSRILPSNYSTIKTIPERGHKNRKEVFQYLDEYAFDNPHLPHDRNLLVHLFEWKWTDIENECKTYLPKYGFGAVQISPPIEHIFYPLTVDGKEDAPWYHRYQPVSYKLESRSGTEQEFISMVQECNKAGVRIIVDMLLNHMASVEYSNDNGDPNAIPRGSNNSKFHGNPGEENFPSVGYTSKHFNDGKCNGNIDNYDDRNTIQFCRLVTLADLDQGNAEVQDIMLNVLNRFLDIGVLGFRLDAGKHMRAQDLAGIFSRLNNLNNEEKQPFLFYEVIDHGDSVIKMEEYHKMGRVKNFNYHRSITDSIRNWNGKKGVDMVNIRQGSNYGNMIAHDVLNFLDNHDNQRYETDSLITHKNPEEYRLAASFMLASTYGVIRLMSSYSFTTNQQGPPSFGAPDYKTKSPEFYDLSIGGCTNGWICEHRWSELRRMAKWRSDVGGAAMTLLSIANDDNCFGFARLKQGYFALNNDRQRECILNHIDTSLPEGVYCNIYAQDFNGECDANNNITVNAGMLLIFCIQFSRWFCNN